ncbi:hypothetical protein [Muricoccus pecuniae]|uniref:Glycoside hydrolase family 5 domain-containing protein n=1 Tax=Muricoccus pecuniae TaxID=693023 RepID=A0A840Y2M8_9PROT|nr:hypothetical protein [Roseomonas pecuniae]MBB5693049.1 hypothetical protein [Roseomonas pecuniae]
MLAPASVRKRCIWQTKLYAVVLTLFILLLEAFFQPAVQARANDELLAGINQTQLGWMPADQRQQILDDLARYDVQVLRVTLYQPFASTISAIEGAAKRDIAVLLNLSLNIKDYFSPEVSLRPGGRVESSYPLSSIDVDGFARHFRLVWSEIERRGIKIAAIEVGNEINWAFNGDVGADLPRPGRVYETVDELPDRGRFLAGLGKYIELLKAVREVRDSVGGLNHSTLIISAGLARIHPDFAARIRADAVDAGLTLSLLAERGLGRYADAAGIHQYPFVSATPAQREQALEDALSDCRRGRTARACWLTEWGISNTSTSCPISDAARADLVRETRSSLMRAAQRGELEAAFYFEWNGKSQRSIWRCGGLTEAGREAIRPISREPGARGNGHSP